ncbi:thioredoxin [Rubrobacter indicoceani]|uniref:thioredoxin n=1 Tax=Rubrobacter indicoceani TaxID=2051957 RepID=UPI000E5BE256|nr:thioredoxin [Rubrobacter indicoceani]
MAVKDVTDSDFKEAVLNADKPVIVDFWAPWCQPCKRIAPVLEQFSEDRDDVEFVKINVDDNPTTTLNYSITSIPTVARFEGGEITQQAVGALPKAQLSQQLGL